MKKKLALSMLLAALFLALAASRVDGGKFQEAMAGIRPLALVPVALLLFAAQVLRAIRWWRLVRPVKPLPFLRVLPPALAGFLAINVFPLRAGEVARPLLLKREGISFGAGLGTVVAERVVDALAVFVMLLASLALVPARTISINGTEVELQTAARLLLVIFVPAGIFLVLLVLLRGKLVVAVERVLTPVSRKLAGIAARVLGTFVQGLELFRSPSLAVQTAALTASIWGGQVLAFAAAFAAFDIALPAWAALPVLAITMAGITIPGGIGMSGNFQLFCVAALALFAIDESTAFAYSVVVNMVGFGIVVVMGLPALPFLSMRLGELAAPSPEGGSARA